MGCDMGLANLIRKIRKKLMSNEDYAKNIGVKFGKGTTFADKDLWPTEPYLITLGDHCRVTLGCHFFTHGGAGVARNMTPDKNFDAFGKIAVGNNVYIGSRSLIMAGVSIGDNVLIAAGSVVTKSIPSGVVVGGNPAKIIGTVEDFVKRNEKFNLGTKKLSASEKKKYLLSLPDEKFIVKKEMPKE